MLMHGVPGVQNNPDSNPSLLRVDKQGALSVSELHARFYEQVYRGNVFSVCTQGTSVTTTAALATTFTGLAVGNPAGSGVNLVLLEFTATQFAAGVAGTIGVMGGTGSITASLTPQSRLLGSGRTSLATATAGQTISTPLLVAVYGSVGSVATTSIPSNPGIVGRIDGNIVIPPGSFIASYTSTAQTSAWQFQFVWEEVPI